ncbi:MAG: DUF6519 domain-containing protein, partial [Bacteroidota bacterium]
MDNATAVAPCTPFSSTGFRGLENQLYRIEIQKSGSINNATYKWSRENGSVETLIYSVDGSTLKVQSTGKDDVLGFAAGQWCEIVNDYSTFHNIPYPLVKIKEVKNATKEILLDPSSSIPSFNDQEVFKLRRWDHQSDSNDGDIPLKTNWVDIEAGIQVKFDNGHYKTGDFWLVEARTLTNDIKLRSSDNGEALGIQHQYAQLAVLKVNNGNLILVDDCRSQFPPLTNICAEDICYDNNNCTHLSAATVQEAIDEICQKQEGSCTYHVRPVEGWEAVFDLIKENEDAKICFQVGNYELD